MSSNRTARLAAAAAMGLALTLTGCASAAPTPAATSETPVAEAGVVQVAAASDLKYALDDVVAEFAEEHPDIEVAVTYGSSGNFATQIRQGAPFNVYLSADITLAEELAEEGFGDPADVFEYAVGRLVVWAAADSPADAEAGIEGLTADAVRTVAIANPEHAPYGRAAVAAMETAGVASQLEAKLVMGENIAQAAEFALSGNADAGIIALSLALSPGMKDAGSYSEVPLDSFPTLHQGGLLLADAPEGARELVAFIQSERGQQILADYGFYPPPGQG